MKQSIQIIARTVEVEKDSVDTEQINTELNVLSGRAAGVCYSADDYYTIREQGEEKALTRANSTAQRVHNSVFEHGHITFMLETNKAMAMILNSMGVYTTSEKSARYTIMKPETELEQTLYSKWIKKVQELILDKYPDFDDHTLDIALSKIDDGKYEGRMTVIKGKLVLLERDDIDEITDEDIHILNDALTEAKASTTLPSYKMAMENARYMISVFTPTKMVYTVSFSEAQIITILFDKLIQDCDKLKENNEYYRKLQPYVIEFNELFKEAIGEIKVTDNKNRKVRFLENCYAQYGVNKVREFRDSYCTTYLGSFAMLAQAQRHRTLRYSMFVPELKNVEFYVPPIVTAYGLEDEWLNDIKSVAECIPQGLMVRITEQGTFEDFVLKCKERLCGRAQLEIAEQTERTVREFFNNRKYLCDNNKALLENMIDTIGYNDCEVRARCKFNDFTCREGCTWGSKWALKRLI